MLPVATRVVVVPMERRTAEHDVLLACHTLRFAFVVPSPPAAHPSLQNLNWHSPNEDPARRPRKCPLIIYFLVLVASSPCTVVRYRACTLLVPLEAEPPVPEPYTAVFVTMAFVDVYWYYHYAH